MMHLRINKSSAAVGLLLMLSLVFASPLRLYGAPIRQTATDKTQADALFNEAGRLFQAGQLEKSQATVEAALALYQKATDRVGEANCYQAIGDIKTKQAQWAAAIVAYEKSAILWHEIGQALPELTSYNNLGYAHSQLGDQEQAFQAYQQALTVARDIADHDSEASILNNIAGVYAKRGRRQEALQTYEQALALVRKSYTGQISEVQVLTSMASVYNDMAVEEQAHGRYEVALTTYRRALNLVQTTGDRHSEGKILGGIGSIYIDLEQYEQALEFYEKTLTIAREFHDEELEQTMLSNIGGIYFRLERYEDALDLYGPALQQFRATGDREREAGMMNNMALLYEQIGGLDQALMVYQQALAIQQEIHDEGGAAKTLNNIADLYLLKHNYAKARTHYEQAQAIKHARNDVAGEVVTLSHLALLYETQKNLPAAIDTFQKAITLTESLHQALKVDELQSAFAGAQIDVYTSLINLLWRTHQPDKAFAYAERAKARTFLDQIGNQQVDFRRNGTPALIEREQLLNKRIRDLSAQLTNEQAKTVAEQNPVTIETASHNLEEARKEYEDLIVELKLTNPDYAALVHVNTLTLAEVQRQVLDKETTLIAFFVMDEYTLAWVIEQDEFTTVEIKIKRDDLSNRVSLLHELIRDNEFAVEIALQLYNTLIAPLKPHIHHHKLMIVPHGVLHYLPFAALWNDQQQQYFLQEYPFSYAPSATVLKFILAKRTPNQNRTLVLGNPGGSLRWAETEAKKVAQLYGNTAFVRSAATESVLRAKAGTIDILHLAAHGVYDAYNPLYSRIELAADDRYDGHLEVHEVYGLDLTGVNLVVLSACETAFGAQSDGDELVGLTRAFLYAGSPAVITTLWPINDEASSKLMVSFYRHLQAGMDNAEALRTAQLELMTQNKWQSPYYWAAFELTGDHVHKEVSDK